jgi:hypothetical protein
MMTAQYRISEEYYLTVYGNGWAYEVEDSEGNSVFVQDHDAEMLQQQTNNFEDLSVLPDYFAAQGVRDENK